jgi:hypothetical protein
MRLAAQHRLSGSGGDRIGAVGATIAKDPGGQLQISLRIRNSGGGLDSARLFLTENGADRANTHGWVDVSPGSTVTLRLVWPISLYAASGMRFMRIEAKNNSGRVIYFRDVVVNISAIPIDIAFE